MNGNGSANGSSVTVMLRMDEVRQRAALSRSFLYVLIARGVFPPFAPLGERARGLPEDDLDLWLAQCLELRSQMSRLWDSVPLPLWCPPSVEIPCRGITMLRIADVLARVSVGRSHLYRLMNRRLFPWPAPFGEQAHRWAEHEVEAWLCARRSERTRSLKDRLGWVLSRPGSRSDDRPGSRSDDRPGSGSDDRPGSGPGATP